jgi:uncharacterized RDD family membrane protein YckC
VLLAIGVAAALVIPSLARASHAARGAALLILGGTALLGLAAVITWNCVWLARYGQTVGKRALHIRIIRGNGGRASLGRIFLLRYLPVTLLGIVPLLGPLLTLTDILLIFRDSRKCLHDQLADTIVVKCP